MAKNNLSVGDIIPEFSLPNEKGENITVSPYDGVKRVLYFYPKDNTRVCTAQACLFRDWHSEFIEQGYVVIGISGDSITSHEKFAAKHELNFTLLSDGKASVRKLFGVSALFGLISGRKTFVISEKGIIEFEYEAMLEDEEHIDKTLDFIKLK